ncbi:hypothetical protein [Sphingomonas sp. PvP018]|uniref:hypothetical protein n=1 Tax=Sphingomonas sp. PvP018 TaxID=2817852 RepID=UPI00120492EF|nr:hypothetical protein [Sphingomonas sp. PvP018]MBP2515038.1 putative membrane protein [Sphingomonas sp. PvP018]RZM32015.1 MAG: hypothetical protein EOP67_29975 [Sphingomonas sp.]
MDALSLFGLAAVSFTLLCYARESGSHWWTFGFAVGCLFGSAYGFLQGAWPFGLVELIWFVVALRRWIVMRRVAEPRR